jgi:hypothetical protein
LYLLIFTYTASYIYLVFIYSTNIKLKFTQYVIEDRTVRYNKLCVLYKSRISKLFLTKWKIRFQKKLACFYVI